MESVLNLVVHNDGDLPTFVRGKSQSYIDVTCSTQKIAKSINCWEALKIETLTQHSYIYFELKESRTPRWVEKRTVVNDWDIFCAEIDRRTGSLNTNDRKSHSKCTEILKGAYGSSVKMKTDQKATTPYWWNKEIKDKRDICIHHRRQLTRMTKNRNISTDEKEGMKQLYRAQKRELQRLIRISKVKLWKELCQKIDEDIWGSGYKIATRELKNTMAYNIPTSTKKNIIGDLFHKSKGTTHTQTRVEHVQPFTKDELENAVQNIKTGKAPGPDGIPPEAIRTTVKENPIWMLDVMNSLLEKQTFPSEWKVPKVVLLPKKDKDLNESTAYRPLCLLNTLSKLYETLIKSRLQEEIQDKGGLSENQNGFTKGKSTIHAVERVKSIVNAQ